MKKKFKLTKTPSATIPAGQAVCKKEQLHANASIYQCVTALVPMGRFVAAEGTFKGFACTIVHARGLSGHTGGAVQTERDVKSVSLFACSFIAFNGFRCLVLLSSQMSASVIAFFGNRRSTGRGKKQRTQSLTKIANSIVSGSNLTTTTALGNLHLMTAAFVQ